MKVVNNKYKFSLSQSVVLVFMFLASMNFFSKYFYLVFIAVLIQFCFNGCKLRIDKTTLVLLCFSVAYVVFFLNTRINLLDSIRLFAYPMCYLIGLNFFNRNDMKVTNATTTQNKTIVAITLVALGAFFHYVLNWIINWGSIYRNNIDIWSGQILNATGQSALAVIAIAVFVANLFASKMKSTKIFSIIGILTIFNYNLILAGRSLVVITIVAFFVACIFDSIVSNRKKYKMFCLVAGGIVATIFFYNQNFLGIKDVLLSSNLSMRLQEMDLFEDLRWERKYQYISKMFIYPFGGEKIYTEVGGHAHGLLLDAYSDAGFIAFVLLLVFLIISLTNLVYIIKCNNVQYDLRLLVLCISVVLFLEFSIEPILAGAPWLFGIFCFYQGLLHRYVVSICYYYGTVSK